MNEKSDRRRVVIGAVCLLAALAVLAAEGGLTHAQSGGGYDLTWSTVDGGGGTVSGGGHTLSGATGQPEPGSALTGGDFTLAGGFWPGGPASPLAVTDLQASKSGNFLRLDWTAVIGDVEGNAISGVTYNVYRGEDAPYFTAGAPYFSGVSGVTYPDPDTNVIGNTQHTYFYMVRAVYSGLTSANSNRVGSFAFGLVPGSP